MTQRHLLELIRADFPDKGDTYLRILANQALSDYAFETLVLRGTATKASDGTNIRFDLPVDCVRLERVFDAATERELFHSGVGHWNLTRDGEVSWWVEDGKLVVGYHGRATSQLLPVPVGFTWKLRYRRYPVTLLSGNMDTELDLPTPLHGAIEARLRERLFAGVPDMSRYWHAVYRDFVRKGKMYGNEQQDGGAFNVLMDDAFLH